MGDTKETICPSCKKKEDDLRNDKTMFMDKDEYEKNFANEQKIDEDETVMMGFDKDFFEEKKNLKRLKKS